MPYWVLSDVGCLVMLTLNKSMIRSRLENCCPVWNPFKISDIQKLENIQRAFFRKTAGFHRMDYWDLLKKLKIMSLQRKRSRYSIIQVWKITNYHALKVLHAFCSKEGQMPPLLRQGGEGAFSNQGGDTNWAIHNFCM